MKELTTEEVKAIQIDILDQITEYCDKEGLEYFLGYGTLLGAVRHQGFIPWDDDIDILMPRPDYEKLINKFKAEDYQIYTNAIEKKYFYTFAKASYTKSRLRENMDHPFEKLGVNIDIFPLDGCPGSEEECKNKFQQIEHKRKLLYAYLAPRKRSRAWYKDLLVGSVKFLISFVNYSKLIKNIDETAAEFDYDEATVVGNLVYNLGYNELMTKEVFANRIKLKFEDREYFAPEQYDKYLTNIYGDYMTLPPVEQRVTHHDFQAFLI